jgi:hypothetical protein
MKGRMKGMSKRESKNVRLDSDPWLERHLGEGRFFRDNRPEGVVLVVAVQGAAEDDWAVYMDNLGIRNVSEEAVARHGTKVSYECAARLFPEWDRRLEWRR